MFSVKRSIKMCRMTDLVEVGLGGVIVWECVNELDHICELEGAFWRFIAVFYCLTSFHVENTEMVIDISCQKLRAILLQ